MAACLPPISVHHHNYHYHPAFSSTPANLINIRGSRYSSNHILSSYVLRRRLSPFNLSNQNSSYSHCRATGPDPPSPPEPGNDSISPSGLPVSLSRFQETVRIFLAVMFWMSLFFWASAWDGRNNGRPGKGSRFRK